MSLREIVNSSSNSSAEILPELRMYRYTELASAIILCVLSPITVISNALLLTAIYKDPLRCFRTPMTFFIVGLALADLLTGVSVEPMFAAYYFADFADFRNKPSASYQTIYWIGGTISTVTINVSFLITLALSVCQYVAVTYPHQFKAIVSRNRVLAFLTVSSVYFTSFSMLQFTGIDFSTYLKIDLIMHATVISVILVVVQIMLFSFFKRHLQNSTSLHAKASLSHSVDKRASYKTKHSVRQFTVMMFYLTAILLVSASPHVIVLYIYLFRKLENRVETNNLRIALPISDLMLFVKVASDIFIYAWRLPSYRRALRCTLLRRQASVRSSVYRKSSEGVSLEQLDGRTATGTDTATV